MKKTKHAADYDERPHQGGTVASAFHLPETLDWSSLSAQIKNRVIVVPDYVKILPNVEPLKHHSTEEDSSDPKD